MKYRKGDDWYPFWIDKWLLGSTRDELIIRDAAGKFIEDLRGIFVDLMTMAYKDNGFIRANEGQPYSIRRLAGSLDVPQEKLEKTIAICLDKKKLELRPDGTLYLTNREKYELSKRTIQRKNKAIAGENGNMSLFNDTMSQNSDTKRRKEKIRIEKKREDKNTAFADGMNEETINSEFNDLWDNWPVKKDKGQALINYRRERKTHEIQELVKAVKGYKAFLKTQRIKKGFDQQPLYLSTFLNKDRWKEYLDEKYVPAL